ncbi:translocation protein [Pseudovirgaria hyperparasitica]|uniref:Translocation protein SEC62 n=1 Tax=Pseudovirgaria hyperparasitica TaxID=470096 RepID=A0A6A6WDF7_9PEZI|nr:translocation protein [Pseudovirgaria hyperparasitica]KAF2760605.1 translocation protein [Pseudovirgaria hyperparasitica]
MASQPPPQGVPMGGPGGARSQGPPAQPSPEQIRQMQEQLRAEAQRLGITVEELLARMRAQAMQQQQMQQQQQQQQQQPIQPGPPKPEALAVADFLKSQDLKPRTVLFQEKRKDMIRVKRAIRALLSPAYQKARSKNIILPEVKDRPSAENTFKLLPLSMLAIRVSKQDPNAGHEGHSHGSKKRIKGQWNVRIEQQQNTADDDYYIWLYEGSPWKMRLYAALALVVVFAIVLFPLWPLFLRTGVWYLSMGMLGLIGLFFVMAIFRLILFCVTVFTVPPGFWLFPNLFEDVGFFDSFRPWGAWQETAEAKKEAKKLKKQKKAEAAADGKSKKAKQSDTPAVPVTAVPAAPAAPASTTGASTVDGQTAQQRRMQASVEEADDE